MKHFSNVIQSDEFFKLDEGSVIKLIESSELEVDSEEVVYKALLSWIKYDLEERRDELPGF